MTAQGGTDRLNRMLKLYHSTSTGNLRGGNWSEGATTIVAAILLACVPTKCVPPTLLARYAKAVSDGVVGLAEHGAPILPA